MPDAPAALEHPCGPWCDHAPAPRWRPTTLDLRALRVLGSVMLALAAVWRFLPLHPPLLCPLRTMTGIPCPLCGMTRSVSALARGDLGASLAYNPGGILVVAAALGLLVVRRRERLTLPAWVAPVALGLLWVWNLTLNPTF